MTKYIVDVERKKQVTLPDGSTVTGTELGFQTAVENWNEYLLDDGTVVRVKLIVAEVVRLDDQYDNEGNPNYIIKSANVTALSAPEELRKKQ
jgi:hypothetical protein